MAGERIARLLKDAKGNDQDRSDILYGRVTRTNPLQIEVEGRFKIGQEHLVLSRTVQDLTLSFNVPTYSPTYTKIEDKNVVNGLNTGSQTVNLQVFRKLQVGDKVSMIRGRKGQLFYVLDRRV